jgi:hypothetical protein
MGLIPPDHDAAAVWIGEFETCIGRCDRRAFSSAARARRWIEDQVAQELSWDKHVAGEEWRAATARVTGQVRRVTLHDPVTLRRRYSGAFNGDYDDE